jgi:hypothetical protein
MKDVDLHLTMEEVRDIIDEGTRHVFRSAPLGRAWDTFNINGKRFELIDVSERSVNAIANKYYRIEHYRSPEDFILGWKASHSGSCDPEQLLYIHWFRDITGNQGSDLI